MSKQAPVLGPDYDVLLDRVPDLIAAWISDPVNAEELADALNIALSDYEREYSIYENTARHPIEAITKALSQEPKGEHQAGSAVHPNDFPSVTTLSDDTLPQSLSTAQEEQVTVVDQAKQYIGYLAACLMRSGSEINGLIAQAMLSNSAKEVRDKWGHHLVKEQFQHVAVSKSAELLREGNPESRLDGAKRPVSGEQKKRNPGRQAALSSVTDAEDGSDIDDQDLSVAAGATLQSGRSEANELGEVDDDEEDDDAFVVSDVKQFIPKENAFSCFAHIMGLNGRSKGWAIQNHRVFIGRVSLKTQVVHQVVLKMVAQMLAGQFDAKYGCTDDLRAFFTNRELLNPLVIRDQARELALGFMAILVHDRQNAHEQSMKAAM